MKMKLDNMVVMRMESRQKERNEREMKVKTGYKYETNQIKLTLVLRSKKNILEYLKFGRTSPDSGYRENYR